jgi:catechol 2,3-dioxygenase-like lactoylglutathione lyase family enzyme
MSDTVRFHISLNVSDLTKAVGFYRALLGVEPAKLRPDYAKFEPDNPPLVLSLEPGKSVGNGGALNHAGFRLPDAKSLVAVQERLERAGIRTRREEGVECCYAKQTKFWAHDPDGTLWEVYTFEGDIDHRGDGQSKDVILGSSLSTAAPVAWEHRMTDPLPDRIPLSDGSADEVSLRGTFNLPLAAEKRRSLVGDAVRVLRLGGRVFVHVLVGEGEVEDPDLPGPASKVRSVPLEADPVALLEAAGLVGVRMLKFDSKPCFVRNGVGMRELQLEGFKPAIAEGSELEVIYKGPFREVRDDGGRVFARGRRVAVPANIAQQFRTGEWASQFTICESASTRPMSVTACGSA